MHIKVYEEMQTCDKVDRAWLNSRPILMKTVLS